MKEYMFESYADYLYHYMDLTEEYVEKAYIEEDINNRFQKSLDDFKFDLEQFWKDYEKNYEVYLESTYEDNF